MMLVMVCVSVVDSGILEQGGGRCEGGGTLPRLSSDGALAEPCPEGEAHGARLADLLSGPTHGTGTCLEVVAGHISEGGGTLARDHVTCCLEGLLLSHGVCVVDSVIIEGGEGRWGASVDTP